MKLILLVLFSLLNLSAQEGDPFADDDPTFDLRYSPPRQIEILYQAYDIDLEQASEILEARNRSNEEVLLIEQLKKLSKPAELCQLMGRPGETVEISNLADIDVENTESPQKIGLHLEIEPSLGDIDFVADCRVVLNHRSQLKDDPKPRIHTQNITNSVTLILGKFMLLGVTTPALNGEIAKDKRRFHLLRLDFNHDAEDYGEQQYEMYKKIFRNILEERQNQK